MSNLFSIFDPQTHRLIYLNWLSSFFLILAFPANYWLTKSPRIKTFYLLTQYIFSEIKAVLGVFAFPGTLLIIVSLFVFIILNNILGLSPYIFTPTAHLTFAVSLALPLWIGHITIAWVKTPENILAHLVPLGTPLALMPFIVLIEIVSNVIRPLTLSVRLAANMVAGHLLLTLLSSSAIYASSPVLVTLLFALILLASLESAVALIQAYVFRILSTLYVRDINSSSYL